jgi:hypothetical protein
LYVIQKAYKCASPNYPLIHVFTNVIQPLQIQADNEGRFPHVTLTMRTSTSVQNLFVKNFKNFPCAFGGHFKNTTNDSSKKEAPYADVTIVSSSSYHLLV